MNEFSIDWIDAIFQLQRHHHSSDSPNLLHAQKHIWDFGSSVQMSTASLSALFSCSCNAHQYISTANTMQRATSFGLTNHDDYSPSNRFILINSSVVRMSCKKNVCPIVLWWKSARCLLPIQFALIPCEWYFAIRQKKENGNQQTNEQNNRRERQACVIIIRFSSFLICTRVCYAQATFDDSAANWIVY